MIKYFLIERLRNKSFLFWSLMFPLVLMLCFKVAFGNLSTDQDIDSMEIAVIYVNEDTMYADGFSELMNQLSSAGSNGDEALFHINEFGSEEDVNKAIIDGTLSLAFKVYDDKVQTLLPKDYTDTACVVGKSVASAYMNNYTLIATAYETNPQMAQELINNLGEDLDFVQAKKSDFLDDSPNPYIWYYYSSLVMGILFNAMNGVDLVGNLKADTRTAAMRVSVSPKKKSHLIAAAYTASLIVALAINVIQLIVMRYVFEIPFGNSPLKLAAFIISGNLFALAFGVVCGCFLKGSIDSRGNKTTAIIMTSVFISGEMVSQLPGFIEKTCPIINDINPATVMNMALFRLSYSNSDFDFYSNMIKIIAAAFVFLVISVIVLRREKYASV